MVFMTFLISSLEMVFMSTVKSFGGVLCGMLPNSGKSSIFSSGKPKSVPWWIGFVLLGLAAAVILYNWR